MSGRKVTEDWCKLIAPGLAKMFEEGQSVVEVCADLGISKSSYYRACELSPEFREASQEGLAAAEAWWTALGRAGAAGAVKIQPIVWIFNMKNRYGWKDKHELSGPDNGPIPLQKIDKNMTAEEASKSYIQNILEDNQGKPVVLEGEVIE